VAGKNDELILALQAGIFRFDPDSETLEIITHLNQNWQLQRFNDGACDEMGRLWIGTMQLDYRTGNGSVYCIHTNHSFQIKIEEVAISNGLTWSADNKKMYYTDSLTREIRCYHFNQSTGEILFEKVVIQIPEQMGLPDGIAMDAAGCLWVALWGGYGVGRWDLSTGTMIDFIPIPAPHVTSCAFIGGQLDELIITTAREGMDEKELALYPKSGHVFIARPGVKGATVFLANL
jgi:sugar lactone lactonase YvrE